MELVPVLNSKIGKGSLGAVVHGGRWFDLGTAEQFISATAECVDAMAKGELEIPPGSVLRRTASATILQAESASLDDGAEIRGFLVAGKEARVEAGCLLENSVLLDGALVRSGSVTAKSIVFPGGALRSVDKSPDQG